MDVTFYFDFGSPNAFLSHRVIPAIEARTGAKFAYVPILLGGLFKLTGNQSPMTAFGHIKNKPDYDLSLIHISEPRDRTRSRMPSSA